VPPDDPQDAAYELAVKTAWSDPSLADVVRLGFLHEDLAEALEAFLADEHWARIKRLLLEAGVEPGAQILDFGGGRGMISAALAREGYVPTLCEPNPSEVAGTGAAERLAQLVPGGFEIVNGTVDGLIERGPVFAAGVCRAVLHHVHPLVPALTDVASVLAPGGSFIASDEPTIRDEAELEVVRREHPFVRFGVDEWAAPSSYYRDAFRQAGFERVSVCFPVSLGDYRRIRHAGTPAPLAVAGYVRYRLRTAVRPHPGETRTIVGRKPRARHR
jgi:2-polyprenyl-3-methyl-5-hydroxy-6-metoxy-1,4-benzoquinol methylase